MNALLGIGAGELLWAAPPWLIWLATATAVVAFLAAVPGARSPWARFGESLCWGVALVTTVLLIAQPTWVEESVRTEPGRVVVLVDASASMGVVENGTPRNEEVGPLLEHVRGQVDRIEIYHFGDTLRPGAPARYDLPGTDLESALDALAERMTGERLAGVVVLTDGLDRGPLRRRFQTEERPTPPTLLGPLTLYQVGDATELHDLAVRSIDTSGYAFLRSPFTIRATLHGAGMEGETIRVKLLQDGAVVTTRRVTLDDEGRAEVRFEVVPERAGRFAYEVQVPLYEDDAVPTNNSMPVVVRVVRDKIRILQVAGAPSWDVKFLRRFLKGDPSVDLVSFFILRTARDMDARYAEEELSLIAFPYFDLFSTDLWTFDAVIFQNFDYEPYFGQRGAMLLENLRDYVVDKGGALVMVGGDRSFGLGGYSGTPLAEVLPVELDPAERPNLAPFQPRLTEAGQRHPITRLTTDPRENGAWWARLHPMDGTNVVRRPHPDAAVLLEHPSLEDADGSPLPILAVREAGKGRTMALTVDSSWRWSMSEAAQGRGNQAYLRFWKNSLRWLMRDPTTSRVTVDTARENYGIGEDVRLVVRVRDPSFAPLEGAVVKARIEGAGDRIERSGVTSAAGDVVLVVPAERRGTYDVHIRATAGTEDIGEAQTVYAVTARDPELDEVVPDSTFLAALAARTDGLYHGPGSFGPVRIDAHAGRDVLERREIALWRSPWWAALVAFCAGLAWWIRRRAGLR